MVRLRPTTPGHVEVEMFSETPTIYLDHWALRKISENTEWRLRFFAAFARRGTLLFSTAHLAEIAANKGASVEHIRSFLEQIGPHWMVVSLDPFEVIKREAEWAPGCKVPYIGDFFFKRSDFLSRLTKGTIALTHLIDMMDDTQCDFIVKSTASMCDALMQSLQRVREAHAHDPSILDRTFPPQNFSERTATRYVCYELMRRFVRDGFTLTRNHVLDFFHTVVPVTHSHIVLLDKHWHAQVEKLKLPTQFVRCFKESTITEFFELLESAPAVR